MSFYFPEPHFFTMENMYLPPFMFSHWNCVLLELEVGFLLRVARASHQELPVRTCQGKPEMSVGMLTKLWADWVFLGLLIMLRVWTYNEASDNISNALEGPYLKDTWSMFQNFFLS